MDHLTEVLSGVLLRGRAYVALLVPIRLQYAIHTRHQHVATDVEFPLVVQERVVYIFLDYVGLWLSVWVDILISYELLDFTEIGAYTDASPPIGDLTRLDDPYILLALLLLRDLLAIKVGLWGIDLEAFF